MLGRKVSLSKFKKIEIVSRNFSNHNAIRLEIKYEKKNTAKKQKHKNVKPNNMLLNNQWITEEDKEDVKKYLETKENKNTTTQNP